MYEVNRSLAIIRPKAPFFDWLSPACGEDIDHLTLDALRSDCTTFLIPAFDEPEAGVRFIDDCFETLFEMELASWVADQALWPANRSLQLFWEWFDVELHTMVIDLVEEEIQNTPVSPAG